MTDDGWIRSDDEWYEPDGGDHDPYDHPDDYDDGGPTRSGRTWAIAAALVLVLGLGVAAAVALSSDDDGGESASELESVSSTTSTTRSLGTPGQPTSSTTAVSSSTTPTVAGEGAGGASSTSTTKKAATTTTSTVPDAPEEPGCSGRGTGTATSGNQAAQISFCASDASPKVGQLLKVYGSAVDPDAEIQSGCIAVSWDGETPTPSCSPRTGVPPTAPTNINESFTFTHTYTTPGPHTIRVAVVSDPGTSKSSTAEVSFTVTVHA